MKAILTMSFLAGAVLFWRGNEIRAENKVLAERIAEAHLLSAGSHPELRVKAVQAQIEELNNRNKDLFKLRNEISQLRRQKQEAEKLRLENQELEKRMNLGNGPGTDESLPTAFLPRSAMVDAGFATPEATLQTFLRSIALGDYKRFNQCQLQPKTFKSPGLEKEMAMAFRRSIESWSNFPGYFVIATEVLSPDKAVMQVKTSRAGRAQSFILQRAKNDWKISEATRWN